MSSEDEKYAVARKRVEQVRGFYEHLAIYLAVNLALFVLNIVTSPGTLWFWYPLLFWGVIVVVHAFSVFLGYGWQERKVEELVKRAEEEEKRSKTA